MWVSGGSHQQRHTHHCRPVAVFIPTSRKGFLTIEGVLIRARFYAEVAPCLSQLAGTSSWPRDPRRKCDSCAQALDQKLCLETDAFQAHWYGPFHHLPPSLAESIFVSMETDLSVGVHCISRLFWRRVPRLSLSLLPLSISPFPPDVNCFLNWGSMAGAAVNTLVWSEPRRWMHQQRDSITPLKSIKWKLTQSSGESFCLQAHENSEQMDNYKVLKK